jgi:hypothetical protein
MPNITFYPLGNADSYRVDLDNDRKLLFDFADKRDPNDAKDKRIDLPKVLRDDLKANNRDDFDVVTFTHLDNDHVKGASAFFYLEHSSKHQSGDRIKISEMWVPAAMIVEDKEDLDENQLLVQAEARHRLRNKKGIRVFSRPNLLKDWLKRNNLELDDVRHLITDAGQIVPGFTIEADGVEFFAHAPFAKRLNECDVVDRNSDSIALHATFDCSGYKTKFFLGTDITHDEMTEIVDITRQHNREERLETDVVKLPHHCSYKSLGPEKGTDKTEPVPNVKWFYEQKGNRGLKIVSTSDEIPGVETIQPPHRQAANYYREMLRPKNGEFLVTMEFPNTTAPAPLTIKIDRYGARVIKSNTTGGDSITGGTAPRAGQSDD